MDTGDKTAPVTKHEFYSALSLVWVFITMAFTRTLSGGSRSWANVIYVAASLIMTISYSVASWRGDVSRKRVLVAVLWTVLALIVGAVAFFIGRSSN